MQLMAYHKKWRNQVTWRWSDSVRYISRVMFWFGKLVCQAASMRLNDLLHTNLVFSILPSKIPGFCGSWRNVQHKCLLQYSIFPFRCTMNGTTLSHSTGKRLKKKFILGDLFCICFTLEQTHTATDAILEQH
jgi:hypothetical protein